MNWHGRTHNATQKERGNAVNDIQTMVTVARIEHEHRVKQSARNQLAAELARQQRGKRSHRLFSRKQSA
jgi:hypothetical protein